MCVWLSSPLKILLVLIMIISLSEWLHLAINQLITLSLTLTRTKSRNLFHGEKTRVPQGSLLDSRLEDGSVGGALFPQKSLYPPSFPHLVNERANHVGVWVGVRVSTPFISCSCSRKIDDDALIVCVIIMMRPMMKLIMSEKEEEEWRRRSPLNA